MKITRAAAFTFAAALGGAALAQDGAKPPVSPPVAPAPPATDKAEKHVNKISDAAKEAFARLDKLIYSPVKLGLKDLTGTVKMEMELPPEYESMRAQMPSMDMSLAVTFTAPDQVKVAAKDSPGDDSNPMAGMMKQMKGRMSTGVSAVVRLMLGIFHPADEYDADAKTVDGKTVVTITSYEKNVEVATMELTCTAEGLPDVGVVTPKEKPTAPDAPPMPGKRGRGMPGAGGSGDGKMTMRFVYGAEGSLRRLDKLNIESPEAPGGVIEQTLTYAEADAGDAKVKVCHRWTMNMGEMQKFGFRFTEMTVNGKAVTLPKPEAK